jgi:hypothetical protein
MITVSLALFFLALPQAAHAQYNSKQNGHVQSVIFDENNYPILKFSNASTKGRYCALYVAYTLTDNQEEAFVVRAGHLHWAAIGFPSSPEAGWLYITPSRIIFTVETGDKSHSFDIPRTALKDKPVEEWGSEDMFPRLEFYLREKLPASNSSAQKFHFAISNEKHCFSLYDQLNPDGFLKFLKRAVLDFNGTMAKFKEVAASLKQSGKIEQASPFVVPPKNSLTPPSQ